MWSAKPVPGAAGSWQAPSASHSPLPPSAREVWTQLYWSIVSVTVAVSKSRSIGCRGTATAPPTSRKVGSEEASAASVRIPASASAPASRGLSSGICGGARSPLCSPVTSSVGSMGSPLRRANPMLRLISDSMTPPLT